MKSNFTVRTTQQKMEELMSFVRKYHKLKKEKGYKKARELFPNFNILSKNLNISEIEVRDLLRELENEGEIERKVSQYYLKGTREQIIKPPKKQTRFKLTKDKNSTSLDTLKLLGFKAIVLFTVIVGIYISIYFTYLWFIEMFDSFRAMCLSLFIVFSSLTSFEIFILFRQSKKNIKFLFFLLWIIIITFSISTGINGQLSLEFNKKIVKQESNLKDNSKVLLFHDYENRIEDIKIEIKSVRTERDKLQEFLSNTNFDTTDDKIEYKNINYRIYLKNQSSNKLREELKKLETEKEKLLKEDVKITVDQKTDFFTWLENIFGFSADKFRFILYLFLAVFADIIPPINFSVVFFYKNKE